MIFLQASFAAEARRIATAASGVGGVVILGHLVPLPFFAPFCFLVAATSFRADGLPIVGNLTLASRGISQISILRLSSPKIPAPSVMMATPLAP
jgi:hypothetical protein